MNAFRNRYRSAVPRPAVTRMACAVAWFMVAFYVLASGRALVPGLCATQAAMDAQCAIPAGGAVLSSASRGCCPAPPKPETCCPDGEKHPVTPEESHCAFCNLVIGLAEAPSGLVLPAPAPPKFADHVPLAFQVAQEVAKGAAPNRAPPA